MLKFAHRYRELGYTPIKLAQESKIPAGPWKHCQGQKITEEEVQQFQPHSGNLGIITGQPSGLLVVDIDQATPELQQQARQQIDQLVGSPLPWGLAPLVLTCNGGLHYWFRSPIPSGNRAGVVDKVDIRGDGGYVVAPPSRVRNRQGELSQYRWQQNPSEATPPELTEAQVQKLCNTQRDSRFSDDPETDYNHPNRQLVRQGCPEAVPPDELTQLYLEVSSATEGVRNDTLNRCAFECGKIAYRECLLLEPITQELITAATMAGLPPSEISATVDRALQDGKAAAQRAVQPSELPEQGCFPFTIGSQGYDYQANYLIKGHLPADSFGLIYGPSGHFKSFIALSIACHIAAGRDWNGYRTQQSKVIYIAGEGGIGVPRRIKAWEESVNDGRPIQDLAVITQPVYVTEPHQLTTLVETVKQFGQDEPVGLIILDTLARCFAGADENKTADMNQFIARCDELRRLTGAAVLVIHHSGKDADKGARGSSALRAAADFEFSVSRLEGSQLAATLTCTKMKDDCGATQLAYPLRPVTLFEDNDGDPVTSLVVLDEGFIVEESDSEPQPLTQNQMAVWQAVRSRQAKGDGTDRKLIIDDLKKLGMKTANFSRWLEALVVKGKLRIDDNSLTAI
ncbi:Bifunctional DNA primase/polymerase, N-terminal [Ferrimonas sediminum]|uniref:Bifunctional DNA primase/polymerase, N-terminal n=1 Tax=Ferrimonas sediminum TaxID=718193 RepID=A0A1G8PZV0_9GAMM|nr:AAA family ATPase [Ferrimonas sediminum]SDI97380.1 Bifunctional DNA primase/polymerase, N-terminal [Ferrimonas sediminum]